MRKIYNEFFHISKHEKIRERIIISRFAVSIAIIVFCLIAMSFTAYAYFSCNITSGSNFIKSSYFKAQITITEGSNPVTLTTDEDYQVATLEKGKTYNVTLSPPTTQDSAKTGFCVITYEGGSEIYHTQQLGADKNVPNEYTPSITFYLTVSENTRVFFDSHWGTSTHYDQYNNNPFYISDNDNVALTVNKIANGISKSDDENNNSTSTTESNVVNNSTPSTEATSSTSSTTAKTPSPTGSTVTSAETTQPTENASKATEASSLEAESSTKNTDSVTTETSSETKTIDENNPATTEPVESVDTPPTETNE